MNNENSVDPTPLASSSADNLVQTAWTQIRLNNIFHTDLDPTVRHSEVFLKEISKFKILSMQRVKQVPVVRVPNIKSLVLQCGQKVIFNC